MGGKDRDGYNEPLSASEDWWNGLEGVVKEILICGGADELLVDPIRELGTKYKVRGCLEPWRRGELTICYIGGA